MMVEARKEDDKKPVADNAASDMSRFAEASSKMFAEQAAAIAVMTAYGMTVAAQMTGMMLGALRGPVSAESVDEPKPAEPKPATSVETVSSKVVELRPRVAQEAKPAAAVEPAEKPVRKTAKQPVKAKAAPVRAPKPARRAEPKAAAKTSAAAVTGRDDLKKISGIGPRLEQELIDRGITGYSDIATLSKAAVKRLDVELGLEGRITRDDWAGQAKALSGGKG